MLHTADLGFHRFDYNMAALVPEETSMAARSLRSGKPGLNDKTCANQPLVGVGERMTVPGAINKSFLLLVVLLAGAFWPWSQYLTTGDASAVVPAMWIGFIGWVGSALIIIFSTL